jgi:hypothetical protein
MGCHDWRVGRGQRALSRGPAAGSSAVTTEPFLGSRRHTCLVIPARFVMVSACVLGAAACGGSAAHVEAATPTTTTTLPTNTTVTTGGTTASTPPANGDGVWSGLQLTITQQSLGRVRVGMTLDRAQIAAGVTFDGMGDGAVYPRTLPAGYPHLYVGEGPNNTVACVGAEISYSDTTPQTVATRDGLHLGDTTQQLLAIYGGRAQYVPKPASGISPSVGYVVTEADGNLAFSVHNTRVVGIKGGAHDLTPSNCTG